LLLDEPAGPVWSIEELARAIGDAAATEDAVRRLQVAGLIHRLSPNLLCISRTAVRAQQLLLG